MNKIICKEVKRLEEIKNHLWFDDEWRASITMLGGFHKGEPDIKEDIRGPVSEDISFNPLDLVEAIRDKQENPDDIFHQMLLLSAETIGEIDRETRETEKFKKRYKTIEKDLWDEMIQLLQIEIDVLYYNVETSFAVSMISNKKLLKDLFATLEHSWHIRDKCPSDYLFKNKRISSDFYTVSQIQQRIIDVLISIIIISPSIAKIIPINILEILIDYILLEKEWYKTQSTSSYFLSSFYNTNINYETVEAFRAICDALPEITTILANPLLNEMKNGEKGWSDAITIAKISIVDMKIAKKAIKQFVEILMSDNIGSVNPNVSGLVLDALIHVCESSIETTKMAVDSIIAKLDDRNWKISFLDRVILYRISNISPKAIKILVEDFIKKISESESKAVQKVVEILLEGISKDAFLLNSIIRELDNQKKTVHTFLTDPQDGMEVDSLELADIIATPIIERQKSNLEAFCQYNYGGAIWTLGVIAIVFPEVANTVATILIEILEDENKRYEFRDLAAKSLGKIGAISLEIAKIVVNPLIKFMVGSIYYNEAFNSLIKIAGGYPLHRPVPDLPPPDIKWNNFVVGELSKLNEFVAIELIRMMKSEDYLVRTNAIKILDRIWSGSSIIEGRKNGIPSHYMGYTPSSTELNEFVVKELIKLIKSKKDYLIRWKVTTILGRIRSESPTTEEKKAEAYILRLRDEEEEIRLNAVSSLGSIHSVSSEVATQILESLFVILKDKNEAGEIRETAAISIVNIGVAIKKITSIVIKDLIDLIEDKTLQKLVMESLIRIAIRSPEAANFITEKAVNRLIKWLEDEEIFIKSGAISILGEISTNSSEAARIIAEKALDKLIKLLYSEDIFEKGRAISVLGEISTGSSVAVRIIAEKALDKLVKLLENRELRTVYMSRDLRRDVIACLRDISKSSQKTARIIVRKAADKWVKFLADKDEHIRRYAIKVLGEMLEKSKTRILRASSTSECSEDIE